MPTDKTSTAANGAGNAPPQLAVRHYLPQPGDLFVKLSGGRSFSKNDPKEPFRSNLVR